MFRAIIVASAVLSASAFVSTAAVSTARGMKLSMFDPKSYAGATAPFGFFDPVGLSNGMTEKGTE
jgi:hypothetical protein